MTKALLEFIAMQIPFLSKRSNTKSKIVRFTSNDVFPKGKSPYYLDCKISNNKLKIENGEESGTYEKLEY